MVLGELKAKSGKILFRKLNERSKELQIKQEDIAEKHNALSVKYEGLENLKVNMNDYIGRNKAEKKESVIGEIKKQQAENKDSHKLKKKRLKNIEL